MYVRVRERKFVCMYVCVCVCERERACVYVCERESVCMYVCVCERDTANLYALYGPVLYSAFLVPYKRLLRYS